MEHEITLTDQNFDTQIQESSEPVLVDFWAPWCMPCRIVGPILSQLAEEYKGQLKVAKVNVDDSPKSATEYGIRSIPTLLLFKDGKPMAQIVGLRSKADLKKHLDAALT